MRRVIRFGSIAAVLALTAMTLTSCLSFDVSTLSSDAFQGRRTGTAGAAMARQFLSTRLAHYAQPIHPELTGEAAYDQVLGSLTNVVGIIPGTELPNQYVVVGAHYDHLGTSCYTANPADTICNGATDNAAGDAVTLAIAEYLKAHPPKRSVVIAFWDGEEEGLLGSAAYVNSPVVPIAQTVAYVNFDIQGSNLVPSLRNTSFAVGAETGGSELTQVVQQAIGNNTLDDAMVSAIFGAFRSDYANFLNVHVPTVFFSDTTGGCYHTAQDDNSVVDYGKLVKQESIAQEVVQSLANDDATPTWTSAPLATFDDLVAITDIFDRSIGDLGLFSATDQATLQSTLTQLHAIRDAGPAAFDSTDVNTLLVLSQQAVDILTHQPCNGFLTSN
jgi:Zn-dependent M28 family amino/carboxypeptidase